MCQTVAELCSDDERHTIVGSIQALLELQKIDTGLLQLSHRQATLAERTNLTKAKSTLTATQSGQAVAAAQLEKVKSEITNLEAANKKCEAQIVKYSQQLRTVIAPREAEALQHEIETVRAERNANDDQELLLLDTSENLEQQLTQFVVQINSQSEIVAGATLALNQALKSCEADKHSLDDQRLVAASSIDAKLIKLYDIKRNKRTTPAVADMHGSKCQSCHLDLSVVELAALKKLGVDEYAECPNCDCYLVV